MVLKKIKFCCGQGNLIMYYCEVCGTPYATEKEAEACERLGSRSRSRVNFNELKKFTYVAYREFLWLLQHHYKIITLSQALEMEGTGGSPYLILRHDVDGSLEAALELAEIEENLGVKATYFVLFSSPLYNLFEPKSMATLRQISAMGHEIGLHYDLEALDQNLLERELDLLEFLLNRSVKCIARHRESERRPQTYLHSEGRIGAQDTTLYDLHISDSLRKWDEEKLMRLFSRKYDRVQISLHPFLWTEVEMNWAACLHRLFDRVALRSTETYVKWLGIWIVEGGRA